MNFILNAYRQKILAMQDDCPITLQEFNRYVKYSMQRIYEENDKQRRDRAFKDFEERLKSFKIDVEVDAKRNKTQNTEKFVCESCQSSDVYYDNNLSSIVCNRCSVMYYKSNCNLVGNYDDVSYATYTYRRINHFMDSIVPFLKNDTLYIPCNIVSAIKKECDEVRLDQVKKALKKPKYSMYKDYFIDIYCRILNKEKPLLTQEQKVYLEKMFHEIQPAFADCCPKTRRNFLSYPYVAYKLLQLLQLHQFLPYITLLKSKAKIREQEDIFARICKKLGWKFVPIEYKD